MAIVLLATTAVAPPVLAQTDPLLTASPTGTFPTPVPNTSGTVRAITVRGTERLEPETVLSYINLEVGDTYDRDRLDKALKELYASELFADATILDDNGTLTITVKENPVINRVLVEGAKRVKEEKVREEIKLAPRQIFTRSKVRADVGRILEVYRRSGRFSAAVEPKIVQLDQNRVDLVYEISEGAKSKVRQINILGNHKFKEAQLRAVMATRQSRPFRIFTSNDTYDPDRLAYDQQKLRQFYLTQGYADFRVVSAVAELTPDRRDFIITYVVDEGERYHFGDLTIESDIRDIKADTFKKLLTEHKGDWYNAQKIENTVDTLQETAGLLGYAFADIRPQFNRDKDKREMNITFEIAEAPRVYVEKININGNVRTKDQVIRREFRLAEGDAFNTLKVKRSRDRLQGLGFFQDKLEVEQKPGSAPDRVILEVNVQEKSTGSLEVSAGYSSLENFILSASVTQRNFRGRAQELRLSGNISSYSKSIEAGFTEPYLFGRNLALGFDIFRRDYNAFNTLADNTRNTTYSDTTTGFQLRTGFAITEFWAASIRYGLSRENVTLDKATYYNTDGNGNFTTCDPLRAGRYLCDAVGSYTTSSVGYSLIYNSVNNPVRPSRGQRFVFSQDLAGVFTGVKYLRTKANYDWYRPLFGANSGFILNIGGEAGYIFGYGGQTVRLTDRFFLGEGQIRGFGIRGVGPRVLREPILADGTIDPNRKDYTDDALGGETYYRARVEVQIPLGAAGSELGLRPSIFTDVGAVFKIPTPSTSCQQPPAPLTHPVSSFNPNIVCAPNTSGSAGFDEAFLGNSASPRVAVGIGVSWNSPFGPFRFDLAKALVKQPGDDPKLFQFNVGTQF
ncbi:MAG: outer membrane protein assembly factor BamA [Sphingomonadaceae bacterium]|nr:outer membrane protein assembly factor BamA [Sphingomonadaceae bacterium]